tara:strand:+ start:421 stop:594 length:174 start_codon:yes stop_codon:yes gene_type:complete
MEIMFMMTAGAWIGTAIAIIEMNVIKPILENDYDFYNAMDQIEMIQLKEGDIIDDNI